MGQRVSAYTIVAPLTDPRFSLLLHGLSGALDKVDRDLGDILLLHRGKEIDLTSPSLAPDIVGRLRHRGYLTTDTPEEEREILQRLTRELHQNDLLRKVPSFSFVPTYRCNLRCPYCFQPHQMHAGNGSFSSILSEQQIDAAFAVVDSYWHAGSIARSVGLVPKDAPMEARQNWSMSEIGLFGGEPLMADTLGAVERISAHAKRRGLRLWGISNGVELHHFAHLLGSEPGSIAELQITVDGMPHHHNKRRVGPGLRSTFDTILKNIGLALDRGMQINIRMNTDQSNIDDVSELAEIFEARGWSKSGAFEFYCAVVTRENGPPTLDRHTLVQHTLRHWQAGHEISSYEQSARSLLHRLISGGSGTLPFTGTAHCAAESGQIMFDSRGDVFGCWEDVGRSELRIGTYDAQGLQLATEAVTMWLQRQPGVIDACSRCPYALIHTSGCGSQARNHSGSIYTNECESFQQYFPLAFAHAYSELEQRLMQKAPAEAAV